LLLRFTMCALLIACAAISSAAQQGGGTTHVLLLDISGSMKPRYENNMKGWLIEPLLRSAAFGPNDRVIVRWFNYRGNASFDRKDPLRRYDGKNDVAQILGNIPGPQSISGNTDLREAVELVLADAKGLPIQGDILIWMITDNVQDVGKQGSVAPLYQRIVGEPNFRAAYIYPLVKENNSALPQGKDAMVMYLLHYSPQGSFTGMDRLADDASRKIGNEATTWIPFEGRISIDEGSIVVNSEPVRLVDGRLELPAVAEGTPPEFNIQFYIKSQLRGREIKSGKLANPKAVVQLPDTIEVEGDQSAWRATVSPTDLALKSQKKSPVQYTARVTAGELTLHPASFWDAVWGSTSEPIDAMLQLTPTDVQTKMDVSEFSSVKNLSSIQNILQQSQNNRRPILIPMRFQVEFSTVGRRILVGAVAAFAILGAVGLASIFFIKTPFELSTPAGEQVLMLPVIGSAYLSDDGARAAVIRKRFGSISVASLGEYTLDGGQRTRRLSPTSDSFVIVNQSLNRADQYHIRRKRRATQDKIDREDDFLSRM
jgi:hypothetical protein